MNVTVTGACVPGVNGGMFTTAFIGVPTTVKDCRPVPALTWSTVTEPGPMVTPKETMPPGAKSPSVTVVVGVQVPPPGVCVAIGVGVAVGVGVGVAPPGVQIMFISSMPTNSSVPFLNVDSLLLDS